jgi:hypothetical protein
LGVHYVFLFLKNIYFIGKLIFPKIIFHGKIWQMMRSVFFYYYYQFWLGLGSSLCIFVSEKYIFYWDANISENYISWQNMANDEICFFYYYLFIIIINSGWDLGVHYVFLFLKNIYFIGTLIFPKIIFHGKIWQMMRSVFFIYLFIYY